jgi:3-deoxy-D-manno-octulosonic-acid transferase
MFGRLTAICAQEQSYADRLLKLGATPSRTKVTGTMKFDTSPVALGVPGDLNLAREVGLDPFNEPIWVCGSTGPGEERIILERYRAILGRFPRLRLVIVPRKPERFDEVAELIVKSRFYVVRRSRSARLSTGPLPPIILGDTVGELKKFYSLAQIVFIGRTLVDLGQRQAGSDMIEPAALGKAVIVGPHTGNFAEPMRLFMAADAMMVVNDAEGLEQAVVKLLSTPQQGIDMGQRAQKVVRDNQGATVRNGQILYDILVDRILPPEAPPISPEADAIAEAAIADESPLPPAQGLVPPAAAPPRPGNGAAAPSAFPRPGAPQPPPARTLRGNISANLNDDLPPPDFIVPRDHASDNR